MNNTSDPRGGGRGNPGKKSQLETKCLQPTRVVQLSLTSEKSQNNQILIVFLRLLLHFSPTFLSAAFLAVVQAFKLKVYELVPFFSSIILVSYQFFSLVFLLFSETDMKKKKCF